jgi:DNA (cytosine-5)-methyltransferase 1
MGSKKLKVVELFAGVGGFRLGLEKSNYEVVWSNQWEPSTKTQHASMVYEARFGNEHHSNEDISTVPTSEIPDHDVLVGGFPCQDYSVATTLHNSKGLKGKKGVLWWSIHRILEEKKNKPKYLFLENVDRLLKSPATQRGRDFAVMLQSLNDLGYAVEWLDSDGTIAKAFPVKETNSVKEVELKGNLVELTNNFNKDGKLSPFQNSGLLYEGKVITIKTEANYNGKYTVLNDILQNGEVTNDFFIEDKPLKTVKTVVNKDDSLRTISTEKQMWEYLKGAKKEKRRTKEGFEYNYAEGGMIYPDALDNASRTIITGEGGKSPSRFKHVVETERGIRRLTPVELERLNMFPDHHTKLDGVTDTKRAFFMGNALVVGVIEKLGKELYKQVNE